MTILDSLRTHARFLGIGALSFAVALGVTRYGAGQPLVQPQSDLGVLLGLALVALFFVLRDISALKDVRTGSGADHASKTGLN